MPNPHFRVEVYSRAGGRSVVAAAAYRSGEVLTASPSVVGMAAYRAGEYLGDSATGETFDYTRKEGVEWSHIYTPDKAPEWASDREQLWNRAELAETRKDARLARGIEASLPRGLSSEQWQTMCGELAGHFTRYGLVVDAALHNVKARDGGENPHIHLLITARPVDEKGFRDSKNNVRHLNSRLALQGWREAWEDITNRQLEAAGREERVSLKSLKAQGIDAEPTKPLGPKASAMEKQGIATPRGDENRRIMAERALLDERRRQEQTDSNGNRGPWFDSFSYDFGGSMDAARDAVHRYRAKEHDDMARKERSFIRAGAAKVGASLKARFRNAETKAPAASTSQTPAADTPPARTATAPAESSPTTSREKFAAALQNHNFTASKAVSSPREMSEGNDLGNLSPSAGGAKRPSPAERFRAPSKDNPNSPDTPRGPNAPPSGGWKVQENTRASFAAKSENANSEVSRGSDTIQKQNHATLQQGSNDKGPAQSEQRQQGAAVGTPNAEQPAPSAQRSAASERGKMFAQYSKGQDRSLANEREKSQEKDKDRGR